MDKCCRPVWPVVRMLSVLTLVLLGAGLSSAAEIHVQSDTLLRSFERDTVSGTDQLVAPAYEYLQLDMGALQKRGLSFHFYGWGRSDLADNNFFSDQTAGEILSGYLEYTRPFSTFVTRLGRQHIFEGVANETVDGLWLSGNVNRQNTFSLYAGQPAAFDDRNGRDGDLIYGGRFANSGDNHTVGVSYKLIENDSDTVEERAGIDYALYLPAEVSLFGSSVYNLDSQDFGEHSIEARLRVGGIDLRPHLEYYRYEDYFGTGRDVSNPFRILAQSQDQLLVYGIDATWRRTESWEYGGKARIYDSDNRDSSSYLSLLTNWYGRGTNQVGGEVGYLASDSNGNDFVLLRVYGYWDKLPAGIPLGFLSTDLLYTLYDKAIFGEDTSLFASLGCGWSLMENLSLKVSADYSQDPYFKDDLRGIAALSYRFDRKL